MLTEEVRWEILPPPAPPIPVLVRTKKELVKEDVSMYEFHFDEYSTETVTSVKTPFTKTNVNYTLDGEFSQDSTVRLDVVEGHGMLRPSTMKVYTYSYRVPKDGVFKSCSSRRCKTTITVRGVSYTCEDEHRTFNVPVKEGDEVLFTVENPSAVSRIGISINIFEFLGVEYVNLTGTFDVTFRERWTEEFDKTFREVVEIT